MGGKNRQRKSSFFSVFNIFKSNNKQRGGSNYNTFYDEGPKVSGTKIWPSDEDKGRWGVADPVIDMRATAYIAQYKKRSNKKAKGGRSDHGRGCEIVRDWPSDYDKGSWGVASPNIDKKARIFIDKQKNRVHHQP
ncbi:hypothetical protein HKD37_03G008666 [Glycine soja]|nr:hypothetical protein GmHk_03G008720 [Glycine max]